MQSLIKKKTKGYLTKLASLDDLSSYFLRLHLRWKPLLKLCQFKRSADASNSGCSLCFAGDDVVKKKTWFSHCDSLLRHASPPILEVTGLIPAYRDSQVDWTEDTCR